MLEEVPNAKQVIGESRRRWFADDIFDLIVWYSDNDEIEGVQLCYREAVEERAMTWLKDKGFFHNKIDDGEGMSARHKMTPLLVADGTFDKDRIRVLFEESCGEMDNEISVLVKKVIAMYPESGESVGRR